MHAENKDSKIDLGEWCGTFDQIKSIEIQLPKEAAYNEHDEKKYYLTPEERERADAARDRVGTWLRERWAKQDGKDNHNISHMNPLSDKYDGI